MKKRSTNSSRREPTSMGAARALSNVEVNSKTASRIRSLMGCIPFSADVSRIDGYSRSWGLLRAQVCHSKGHLSPPPLASRSAVSGVRPHRPFGIPSHRRHRGPAVGFRRVPDRPDPRDSRALRDRAAGPGPGGPDQPAATLSSRIGAHVGNTRQIRRALRQRRPSFFRRERVRNIKS